MTRALDYAAVPAAPPLNVWRLMLWLVYYTGWAAGAAVLGIVGAVALFETIGSIGVEVRQWVSDDVALTCGPIIGVAIGVVSAVMARRSRWPQVILVFVGGVASFPLARAVWSVYGGRRPLGWDALALLIYCVLLAGSLSLLLSGTAGLMLNRRKLK